MNTVIEPIWAYRIPDEVDAELVLLALAMLSQAARLDAEAMG